MHGDPEALVDGRLLRDPEDPRELVLQRARAVGLDVRCRQREPFAAPRQELLERRLVAGDDPLGADAGIALGVEQQVVQRRGQQDLALLGRRRLEDRGVRRGERVLERLAARAARAAPPA